MPPKGQKDRILSNFTKSRTHRALLVRELPLLPVDFEDQEEDCRQPPPETEQVLVWNWTSSGNDDCQAAFDGHRL
jgi:hypothetical protein